MLKPLNTDDLRGARVTVMGLGLNGGGVPTARFLAKAGALVTVTDMKDESALAESVSALDGLGIRFVLGRHERGDFSSADLVVKNPAVRPDNEYLALSRRVETDLSIFLGLCPAPVLAVTGSKGKSTTSSALAHVLRASGMNAYLGGNITMSPLSFLSELSPSDRVVLELSSWQLGDLKGRGVLKPLVAVLTRIVPDHLDRYAGMDEYVADKRLIYADQGPSQWTLCDADDPYGRSFAAETKARVLWYGSRPALDACGARLAPDGSWWGQLPGTEEFPLVPAVVPVPGAHNRRNMAAAALAAWAAGAEPGGLAAAMETFPGVEHRLEHFADRNGSRWYNDSAATVPEAVAAALDAFSEPIVLITGGTDKNLDFRPVRAAYRKAKELILLSGTGTEKLRALLDEDGVPYHGPYADFIEAVQTADHLAAPGHVVILSPGCTSFGMFKNEFDRGRSFKTAVAGLP